MANFMRAIVLLVISGWLGYPVNVYSQDPAGTTVAGQIQDTLSYDSLATNSLTIDDFSEEHPLQWENVKQDARIAYLLRAHREAVDRQLGIPGYRIHLHMDSGNRARLNTQREQAEFEEEYPDIPSYIIYEEPYFKLRAGDFRTRLDARRFLEKISDDYSSAYIVVDLINFPQMD